MRPFSDFQAKQKRPIAKLRGAENHAPRFAEREKRVHFEPELHKIYLKIKKQTHSGPYRVPLFLQTVF